MPIGGTSAGMMILSGFNYIAYPNTINSAQALANPYLQDSTSIKGDFWNSSANGSVWSKPTPIGGLDYFVSDSHFAVRDRMGRLMAFLARLSAADAGSYGLNLPNWFTPRAIGVDQETAMLLDATSVGGMLTSLKGTTLTKEMFLNHLYGGMDEPELKIIDVFICKLRKKLANASEGRNFIETVWGRGYVLREPHDDEVRIPA